MSYSLYLRGKDLITQLQVLITKRVRGNCSSRLPAANPRISLVPLFHAVCLLLNLDKHPTNASLKTIC